jgi:hypothetical protein
MVMFQLGRSPRLTAMSADRRPLLSESIVFSKKGQPFRESGYLELYDDKVVLKSSTKVSVLHLVVTSPPPTFPPTESEETVQFKNITRIREVAKTGFRSKKARIELQTDAGVTWEIIGKLGVYGVLQNAYQVWKDRNK